MKNRVLKASLPSIVAFVAISLSSLGGEPAKAVASEQGSTETVSLGKALDEGMIKLGIQGGAGTVRLLCERDKAKAGQPLQIMVPAGHTRLGFIHNKEISFAGRSARVVFGEVNVVTHRIMLGSDILDSEGFGVVLEGPLVVMIAPDKQEGSASAKGALEVKVPYGFLGFSLAGITGEVVEGEIEVSRNSIETTKKEDHEWKFHIAYGDMKVKQGSVRSSSPSAGASN